MSTTPTKSALAELDTVALTLISPPGDTIAFAVTPVVNAGVIPITALAILSASVDVVALVDILALLTNIPTPFVDTVAFDDAELLVLVILPAVAESVALTVDVPVPPIRNPPVEDRVALDVSDALPSMASDV